MWRRVLKSDFWRSMAGLFFLLVALAAAYLFLAPLLEVGGVKAPESRRPTDVRLGQWGDGVSARFHHESQGTRVLPLSWFLALEQPVLTPLPVGKFADRDYMSRFGFLYEKPRPGGDAYKAGPNAPGGGSYAASVKSAYTDRPAGADEAEDAARFDLPVGFAIEKNFEAPYARPPINTPTKVVGLTCAACHTGRLDVNVGGGTFKSVLIDGGSAMIYISLFQDAVSRSLYYTQLFPMRFRRFARGVLGTDLPDDDPALVKLRSDLDMMIRFGLATRNYAKEHKLNTTDAGFARTDALGLIGNRVFGVLDDENQVVTDAPVNFPHLWDTSWFDWVQYNGSIRTPLARNVGEALGVGAPVNLAQPTEKFPLYSTTVNLDGLKWMEDVLGGPEPFAGLAPPSWKDMNLKVFGKEDPGVGSDYHINQELADQGHDIYHKVCIRCHVPPHKELREDLAKAEPKYFSMKDPGSDRRFVRLKVVDLHVIGTDPNQALNFYRRVAVAGEPEPPAYTPKPAAKKDGGGDWEDFVYWSPRVKQTAPGGPFAATISAEDGLFRVTSLIRANEFRKPTRRLLGEPRPIFPDADAQKKARMEWDRFRFVPPRLDEGDVQAVIAGEEKDWIIRANLGYRSRPHDGVWATPPFLHNGSVPNLYEMLLPASLRSARFALGSTRFDPKRVGYETQGFPGAFVMDTSLPGNSNAGHEFRNFTLEELEEYRTPAPGVTREQRWASVLPGVTLETLATMSPEERWRKVRDATEKHLNDPNKRSVRGVIGVEFTDEERWALVEYLKTL
ncbi:MAG: di-heme-cytochrome C peroxidase [Isosphaeraceae bacterium]